MVKRNVNVLYGQESDTLVLTTRPYRRSRALYERLIAYFSAGKKKARESGQSTLSKTIYTPTRALRMLADLTGTQLRCTPACAPSAQWSTPLGP